MSAVEIHQIGVSLRSDGHETYTHGGLSATHRADALRRLLRLMVGADMSGSAEVRGEDGKRRMTVRDIVTSSRLTLSEDDRRGFQLRPHRPWKGPNAEDVSTASGLSVSAGSEPAAHA